MEASLYKYLLSSDKSDRKNKLHYVYEVSIILTLLEIDGTISQGKQSMVSSDPYVISWVELRSSLSYDDIASDYRLTTKQLYT
ncbi:hypothetical protein GCM10025777_01690 [Membranihabitans marinus]